jgi:predicted TPR repeat methyltransferase
MRNLGILRLRPVGPSGGYGESHLAKGEQYHDRFATWAGRALMFECEKAFIAHVVSGRPLRTYLDFASGTGRLLDVLAPHAEATVALDVSASMLNTARMRHPDVTYVTADFRTGPIVEIGGTRFDLITAFRFFANAEPALRVAAMTFLADRLDAGGVMIVNNHRNFWSLPYVTQRLIGRKHAQYGMTDGEFRALAAGAGLRVVEHASFGVLPQTDRVALLGWRATRTGERANARWLARRHTAGYDVIYVLQHAK